MIDRSASLRIIGAALLVVGVAGAFVGPLEVQTFYAFTSGGRFHYEGFGVGSFMFANIVAQTLGYYVIGAAGIVLGFGHLALRRWSRPLMLTLLWVWLLVGLPLTFVAFVLLADSKEPSTTLQFMMVPLAVLVYPVVPVLLIRFYNSPGVIATYERRQPPPSYLDTVPLPVRVLCLVLVGYILALHFVLLFRGLFPLFGQLLSDGSGILAIDLLILVLAAITWGLIRLSRWAWWACVGTFGLLTLTTLVTLPRYSFRGIMAAMRLPEYETALFQRVPFLDLPMTVPAVIPLLATVGVILVAGRSLAAGRRPAAAKSCLTA